MLDVTGNSALDVLIGMSFFFFLLSVVCSAVNEGIATAFNLRAKELERGIRQLLADPAKADAFYTHWRIQALHKPARFLFSDKKPSYIPARTFALTLLDTFAPPPSDTTDNRSLLERAQVAIASTESNETVKGLLQDALNGAVKSETKLREGIEQAFNDVMERASGWYKRRVQLILFVIALALVGAMNADSFTIGQRLWKDDALRAAVVRQAQGATSATNCDSSGAQDQTPADAAAACVDKVKQLGIPLGWSKANSPSGWEGGLAKALGLLVTAFALLLGAPFWFDILGRVAKLRGSGPPPTASASGTT